MDLTLLKARENHINMKLLLNFKRLKRDHFYNLLQTIFLTNAKSSCFKSDATFFKCTSVQYDAFFLLTILFL